MKLIINGSSKQEDIDNLNMNIAYLKAILIIESIKQLTINDKDKKKLLDKIISKLESVI